MDELIERLIDGLDYLKQLEGDEPFYLLRHEGSTSEYGLEVCVDFMTMRVLNQREGSTRN